MVVADTILEVHELVVFEDVVLERTVLVATVDVLLEVEPVVFEVAEDVILELALGTVDALLKVEVVTIEAVKEILPVVVPANCAPSDDRADDMTELDTLGARDVADMLVADLLSTITGPCRSCILFSLPV